MRGWSENELTASWLRLMITLCTSQPRQSAFPAVRVCLLKTGVEITELSKILLNSADIVWDVMTNGPRLVLCVTCSTDNPQCGTRVLVSVHPPSILKLVYAFLTVYHRSCLFTFALCRRMGLNFQCTEQDFNLEACVLFTLLMDNMLILYCVTDL